MVDGLGSVMGIETAKGWSGWGTQWLLRLTRCGTAWDRSDNSDRIRLDGLGSGVVIWTGYCITRLVE